jgi:HK97 family phage major capsid protein
MSKLEAINLQVQQISRLFSEANAITSKTTMTKADEARHAAILAEISMLKAGVSPNELAAARMEAIRGELGLPKNFTPSRRSRVEVETWRAFAKGEGEVELRDNLQATSQWGNVAGESYDGTSGTKGGVLVPASYDGRLFTSLGTYDEILNDGNCDIIYSERGSASTTPAVDDVSGSPASLNQSTKVDESVQSVLAAPITAKKVAWAKVPTYRSGKVNWAFELEDDMFEAAIDLLERVFAQRHALKFGADAVANVVAALPSVVQRVTTASSTLVDHFDFQALYKALPKIYRSQAVWYVSDDIRADLMTSLEANARPMIERPDSFWGKHIAICNSLPSFSAGQKNIAIFAAPDYLIQRRVTNGTYVRRYKEASGLVEYGLTAYESFMRADFQPMLFDSAFPPVAVLDAKS